MGIKKLKETVHNERENIENIKLLWNEFKERSLYLISPQEQSFLELLKIKKRQNSILRLIGFFSRNYRIDYNPLNQIATEIKEYNNKYINKKLELYRSFFDGKDDNLKYGLDNDQRRSVIIDNKYNLLIAGAGSGKTSVITSKIVYLLRTNNQIAQNKERILALGFTRVSAHEMEERLKNWYNLTINISTFHAIGYKIIKEEEGKSPHLLFDGNENKRNKLISEIIDEKMHHPEFERLFLDFIPYQGDLEKSFADDPEIYFKYMQNKKYTTLNNIEVKSISECKIGNFLFCNQLQYEYEPLIDWSDEDNDHRSYHPDFYLPEYDIYIEHWGMDREGNVPEWFSITSEQYQRSRNWKLEQFQKYDKKLIETWEYERKENILIENLRKQLECVPEIQLNPLKLNELKDILPTFKDDQSEIKNQILSFISIAKSNFLSVKDIEDRISASKNGKYTEKQIAFGKIALEIYREYQNYLDVNHFIDFNDMINNAIIYTKKNPMKYQNMYDYILIDEFQDISYQRVQLIKAFVNNTNKTRLFCVGDDWQSIYQFNGSDVQFFLQFESYFPLPSINYLINNYRSTNKIVTMANHVIANNKNRVEKTCKSNNYNGMSPLLLEFSQNIGSFKNRIIQYYELIKSLLENNAKPSEIMVISRFNNILNELQIYCGSHGISIDNKINGIRFYSAHKSKGTEAKYVILIDIISGKYGFPSEIKDSSVVKIAQTIEKANYIEEERRLFYVSLTRTEKFLFICTIENKQSIFINELKKFVKRIYIDNTNIWEDSLREYLKRYMAEEEDFHDICPICGRFLQKIIDLYGEFMVCKNHDPKYFFEINENDFVLTLRDLYNDKNWTQKKCVNTKYGQQYVQNFIIPIYKKKFWNEFWNIWNKNKIELNKNRISVSKYKEEWKISRWI